MLCERVLEEEGVLGDITLGEFAMEWIPFEDDLISMELDNNTWKELNLVTMLAMYLVRHSHPYIWHNFLSNQDGDTTAVHQAAKSLMKLQQIYGLFPRIIGKGDSAKVGIWYMRGGHTWKLINLTTSVDLGRHAD